MKCPSQKKSRSGAGGLDKLVGAKEEGNFSSVRKDLFNDNEDDGQEDYDWCGPRSPANEETTL